MRSRLRLPVALALVLLVAVAARAEHERMICPVLPELMCDWRDVVTKLRTLKGQFKDFQQCRRTVTDSLTPKLSHAEAKRSVAICACNEVGLRDQ